MNTHVYIIIALSILFVILILIFKTPRKESFDTTLKYFKIYSNVSNGKNLDIDKNNQVIVNKESNEISQQWSYDSYGYIKNRFNNFYLTIYNNIIADGTPLFVDNINKSNNEKNGQMWIIDKNGYIYSKLNHGYITYNNKDKVFIQVKKQQKKQVWVFKLLGNNTASFNNIFRKIKQIYHCSTKIEDHPDFYKYMLKADCGSTNCLNPINK